MTDLVDAILDLFSRNQETNNETNLANAPGLSNLPPILLSDGTDAGKVAADMLNSGTTSGLPTVSLSSGLDKSDTPAPTSNGQIRPKQIVPVVNKTAADTGLTNVQLTQKDIDRYANTYGVKDPNVLQSILKASQITGADPDTMLKIAKAESNFNPNADNPNSSAAGLYQFINSTWKGLGQAAKKTYSGFKGNVLDPMDNAIAGGVYINQLKDAIAPVKKSGDVTIRDIYLAHFSGPAKAKVVIKALDDGKGNQLASNYYSKKEMYQNPTIFFGKSGKTRTLQEVYDLLTNKVA